MSEEIKAREERLKNNDLWNNRGWLTLEYISIETMEELRKEKNHQIEFEQINKAFGLARPIVSYIAKYDLFDSEPQPMPDDLIKALKDMPQYQVKNYLENFKKCKEACRLTIDQFDKWILQIEDADRQDIYEVCITFEPYTGGSKSSWLHGTQMERFKKETTDKKNIVEEVERYYDNLLPAFEKEMKERENSEKVKEIINETEKLVKEHQQLTPKITKAITEFEETQSETQKRKIAKTFIEGRERLRIIENEIFALSQKFVLYETSPSTKLPTLDNEITTKELQYSQYSTQGVTIKKIERMEASKKA